MKNNSSSPTALDVVALALGSLPPLAVLYYILFRSGESFALGGVLIAGFCIGPFALVLLWHMLRSSTGLLRQLAIILVIANGVMFLTTVITQLIGFVLSRST